MSKRSILGLGAGLALLPALALGPSAAAFQGAAASDAGERVLRDRDHEGLGKLLATCIESLSNQRVDRVAAQAALREEFEKLEKRRSGGTGERPMLALTKDLGRALWLAQGYAGQRVRAGSVEAVDTTSPFRNKVSYAVAVPGGYNPRRGDSYPLLLLLPDVPTPGQPVGPQQFLTDNWVDSELRKSALLVAVGMPAKVEAWASLGEEGVPGGVATLLTVLLEVTRKYAVDFDRIYLVGHGAGVDAAMRIGAMFPDRFAGVIGRRGDAAEIAPGNFKNLPTLLTGAGARATAFEAAAKAAELDNVTLAADASEADVWKWAQEHPRRANPLEVVLVPGSPFPHKAYWLEVPASEGGSEVRIRAVADKTTNTIRLETKGVSEVTLFFNDDILDLDRPIQVISNGKEHPQEVIPRNFNTFLALIYGGRNDPGKLYVASKRYDVTE